MDIGSVRPVVMPAVNAPVPRAPAAAEQATTTDLPVGSTVTKSGDTASVGSDTQSSANQQNLYSSVNLRSTFTVDEEADTLVYRQIDKTTGSVVTQIPDESRLRLRAMINTWTKAMQGSTGSTSSTVTIA